MSKPRQPEALRWRDPQADKVATLRAHDPFHRTRTALSELAEHVGEWAGIPTPIDGEQLHVHPSYPYAFVFDEARKAAAAAGVSDEAKALDDCIIRNEWWSSRIRGHCLIWQYPDGRIDGGAVPAGHHFGMDFRTMACSYAWGIEQEGNALRLLGTMVRHHMFKSYLLTGMFVESSARSGVSYIFRKLRPTIAAKACWPWWKTRRPAEETLRILTCLCMHPIGYYDGTWAGAMCPTDDVIAHLTLMRADEALYWKRCNQIPPWMPNAGL